MSGYYSDVLLDDIKNANDILDVVSEYVKLKRSGRNYFGLCPFHSEKTPSFSVSPDKQIFHCFGCGSGGNVIHFISKIENLEFIESVRFLADRARIQLPEPSSGMIKPEKIKLKERILQINIEAARYFHNLLIDSKGNAAKEYLKNRGITSNIVKKFGIGFAHGTNDDLCSSIKTKGFSDEEILESGLAYRDRINRLHDKFRARVMFPILDVRDRVIGFGGRVLDNSMPKYMNSPETMLFNKRKNLYGLNLARKSEEKTVIVVEGYMDAISLYQHGVDNVAATLGTSFTQEQGRLLRKYFDEIVICYDSDKAGEAAALRGIELLTDMEMAVRVMRLVDAKDPDEFIRKKGANLFKGMVSAAKSLAEFKIELLREQYDLNDTKGKITFVNKMAVVLAKVQNNIERDAYIKEISQETGIGIEPIYAEINKQFYGKDKVMRTPKLVQAGAIGLRKPGTDGKELNPKIIQIEKMLIALLSISDKQVYEYLKENKDFKDFESEINRKIAEKIYRLYQKDIEFSHSEVLNLLESDEEVGVYTEIIQREYNFDDNFKVAKDLLESLERVKLESRLKALHIEMKNPDISEEDIRKLDDELKDITLALGNMKKN